MKQIYNWRKATVFDTEGDGLLDIISKFHVLCCELSNGVKTSIKGDDVERIKKFFKYHIDNEIPVVAHFAVFFDIPAVEKVLGIDLSKLMVIDTVAVSWYLNVNRNTHGLDSFFEDYGIAKPKVDDWEGLTYEEYENRCVEDVKINVALWEDLKERLISMYTKTKEMIDNGLVDGLRTSKDEFCYLDQYKGTSTVDQYIDRILTFLMFKLDCARLQEVTRFKVDVELLEKQIEDLDGKIESSKEELVVVMPKIPKYSKRNKPAEPYKKNGELSVSGTNWNALTDKIGILNEDGDEVVRRVSETCLEELVGYKEPNVNSPMQLKDWFFSLGWVPKTFKYVKDKEAQQIWVDSGFQKKLKPKPRLIPQINMEGEEGKELCDSILELAEDVPEILAYSKYSMIKHRLDTLKGFLREMDEDGYLKARIGGFTNTLRVKHRELVNLVGVDKPYGEYIRGVLTCAEDEILLGTDLSSLEDRVKHHFMIVHDPDYVETMLEEDFDPHILMAFSSGMITEQEYLDFKKGIKPDHVKAARKAGKSTNYASVYNAGAETIARSAGVSTAEGKRLHEGYWKLNWAVKTIAEEQCVITDKKGLSWLINPINGFCYSLRKESDKFSTLCQGTGSFFFDMWVDNMLEEQQRRYGKKTLSGSWHDEFVLCLKDSIRNRGIVEGMVIDAIHKVNETFRLRRDLGCDVQFGKRYSEIH